MNTWHCYDFSEFRVPAGRYYLSEPLPLLMRGGRFSIIADGKVTYYLRGADCLMRVEGDASVPQTIDIDRMLCEL